MQETLFGTHDKIMANNWNNRGFPALWPNMKVLIFCYYYELWRSGNPFSRPSLNSKYFKRQKTDG